MLMGHPPHIIARGRDNAPQGCFEGLTPVPVPRVMEELIACDSKVKAALADTLERVQEMTQAGPHTVHRVAVHTYTVRVTPRIRARTMIDRPRIIVGRGAMVDGVCIGEALRPGFHLGGDNGFDGRGAHILQHFQRDLRSWRVLVGLVTALPQALVRAGDTGVGGGSAPLALDLPREPSARGACRQRARVPLPPISPLMTF